MAKKAAKRARKKGDRHHARPKSPTHRYKIGRKSDDPPENIRIKKRRR